MKLDLRSLAAFRILLGFYFIWDIYSRLSLGRWDLAWYTSDEESSFLDSDDSPHKALLHRLWFYRGSSQLQILLFLLTLIAAMGYTVGFSDVFAVPLWVLVTAQQNRNMWMHDGSDNFSRQMLLWTCFLPMSTVWKIGNKKPHRRSVVVSSVAAYGLGLQVLLMYLGTVCHRTVDLYSFRHLHRSEWLPPKLDAVHYALSGSFAVRENYINHMIQTTPALSKTMTLAAMIVEFFCPIACVSLQQRWRYPFALALCGLHCGLLVSMRLPHWQLLAIATQSTVWLPSYVWDRWQPRPKGKESHSKPLEYSKDHNPNIVVRLAATSLLVYMLLNFAGERRWIKKFDNGE